MNTKSVNNKFVKLIEKNNGLSSFYKKTYIDLQLSKKTDNNSAKSLTFHSLNLKQKKIIRLSNRLVYLKKTAIYPEQVETIDCKSLEPDLIVALKNNVKNVTVPKIWQSKTKYLVGNKHRESTKYKIDKNLEKLMEKRSGINRFNVRSRLNSFLNYTLKGSN
mmetsp:Transcript_10409/g.18984  ORF Transcript_10409/g.18984 Transcript_10409/m.18984 type:complete len:162 (-) Transcript_10409:201-686(-)